jgi:formylglycine-generating enzyme required for sulfatase activity
MKSQLLTVSALTIMAFSWVSCFKGKVKDLPDNGQLVGVAPSARGSMGRPIGMVYVPPGTFHMGPSDEDINYNFTARNKQVSINGFWMDATEITNNEYRQFVNWVRDSLAAIQLGYMKQSPSGDTAIDWKKAKTINYGNTATLEKLNTLVLAPDNRIYNRMEIDPSKLVYNVQGFDLKLAAKRENALRPRKDFIYRYDQPVYPDTLVWIRDFSYSYNEPMAQRYFTHPSFGNYPVVGVTWKQAVAFCHWRSHYLNSYLERVKKAVESDYRLPTEAEWAYNFQHDMNPDVRYNALDSDPPRMKRKVVRGGSWKDVGYFLQTSTRQYEYQDTAKSFIGFRCVIDLPAQLNGR